MTHAEPRLVTYYFVLDEALPVTHQSTWMTLLDGVPAPSLAGLRMNPAPGIEGPVIDAEEPKNFVSLGFWQVSEPAAANWMSGVDALFKVLSATGDEKATEILEWNKLRRDDEAPRTVVAAVTAVGPEPELADSRNLPVSLTRCIDQLIEFVRSVRVSHNLQIPELTYERLHAVVPRYSKPLASESAPTLDEFFLLHHGNLPKKSSFLQPKEVGEVGQYQIRLKAKDPIIIYMERRLEGRNSYRQQGRYADACVNFAAASEVILSAVLGLALWEETLEGRLTDDAASDILAKNLTSKIKNEYQPRFGGTWNTSADGPLKDWDTQIAQPRHRIVHAGWRPERSVAERSEIALSSLETFIADRLANRVGGYTRTAWIILGEYGFEKRGILKSAQRHYSRVGGELLEWLAAYAAWRDEIDPVVRQKISR